MKFILEPLLSLDIKSTEGPSPEAISSELREGPIIEILGVVSDEYLVLRFHSMHSKDSVFEGVKSNKPARSIGASMGVKAGHNVAGIIQQAKLVFRVRPSLPDSGVEEFWDINDSLLIRGIVDVQNAQLSATHVA